jgi:hypothetical protein
MACRLRQGRRRASAVSTPVATPRRSVHQRLTFDLVFESCTAAHRPCGETCGREKARWKADVNPDVRNSFLAPITASSCGERNANVRHSTYSSTSRDQRRTGDSRSLKQHLSALESKASTRAWAQRPRLDRPVLDRCHRPRCDSAGQKSLQRRPGSRRRGVYFAIYPECGSATQAVAVEYSAMREGSHAEQITSN